MNAKLLRQIWNTGFRLKCPVCEKGDVFATFFTLNKICPNCGVRFERETGEATGGMTVSIVVLGVIFLIGYPLAEILTDLPLWAHLAFWLPFSIVFPILFYRYSRALWVLFLNYTNAIRQDTEAFNEPDLTIVDAFTYRDDK